MAYAEKTTVSVAKTKADIEELVQKYGADQFISGYRGDLAVIGFSMADRQVRFVLPLPEKKDFMYTPGRNQRRSDDAARTAWEQACRSQWRSLYLVIKTKMEAVDAGISTIERELLSNIVLPDGQTVGEWMAPQLETAYTQGNMPALLPMLEDCNQNG